MADDAAISYIPTSNDSQKNAKRNMKDEYVQGFNLMTYKKNTGI